MNYITYLRGAASVLDVNNDLVKCIEVVILLARMVDMVRVFMQVEEVQVGIDKNQRWTWR